MLTQVLLVSGEKLNTATAVSVGLKLEPSGLQKLLEIFREGMERCPPLFFLPWAVIHTPAKERLFNGQQAGLLQEFNLSHTTKKATVAKSVEVERIYFIYSG